MVNTNGNQHTLNDRQLSLLDLTHESNGMTKPTVDYSTAPIITGDALELIDNSQLPQLGLFGSVVAQHGSHLSENVNNPAIFLNLNAPFSALLCGVQGSGKSHSLAVLLESALLQNPDIGHLPEPLSTLLFHFDSCSGAGEARPCEAAYLAIPNPDIPDITPPQVVVLVSPNCINTMRRVYTGLNVFVKPFNIAATDMTANRLLDLMQMDNSKEMPLYMQSILAILREMGADRFSYAAFRHEMSNLDLNPTQRSMLDIRLHILDSFVKPTVREGLNDHCRPGRLVIVDLSDPFIDAGTACALFQIAIGIYVQKGPNANEGKLVVFDEAHKYLTAETSSGSLTGELLSLIRQQRHLGCRFVLATQEPTVIASSIIDLCSIVLAYRFSSPSWASHLAKHVSGSEVSSDEWFDRVVDLPTGQAILFSAQSIAEDKDGKAVRLGRQQLTIKLRKRLTFDGGRSILAAAV